MTFIPSSVEVAFLWNIEHGLLGQPVQQYLADHPDHEDALLRIFRLGGNDLVKDLIERGADVTAFQPADVVPPTIAVEPETAPKPTWREQVKNADHYLMAFGIAGALVRNGLIEVDLFDVRWYRTFEHVVSTVEDALNALDN